MDFLNENELPEGMVYSGKFLRLVERGITYLEPWLILDGEQLRARYNGLKQRYSDQVWVPFARREDCDDVACWNPSAPGKVFVIHDFSSPGNEIRFEYANFYEWLRKALEDMIEFDSFED